METGSLTADVSESAIVDFLYSFNKHACPADHVLLALEGMKSLPGEVTRHRK